MAEFQNGMRDPYGIGMPDVNEDTYGNTAKRPQAGWVAGGQTPTGGDGGLPVSPSPQSSGPYMQVPGPLGQVANSPPPPSNPNQPVADWAPPSAQGNQPVLRQVPRPELKAPSTASYVFDALAHGLRGRASGALFGALAAGGNRQRDQNAMSLHQYNQDRLQANQDFQAQATDVRLGQADTRQAGLMKHYADMAARPSGSSLLQQYHEYKNSPDYKGESYPDFVKLMSQSRAEGHAAGTPDTETTTTTTKTATGSSSKDNPITPEKSAKPAKPEAQDVAREKFREKQLANSVTGDKLLKKMKQYDADNLATGGTYKPKTAGQPFEIGKPTGTSGPATQSSGAAPQFSHVSSSGKFGWDGTKWVPISQ